MLFKAGSIALILISQVLSLDLNCNTNVVYYWGQNSYGAAHGDQPDKWEKDLRAYCDAPSPDIITLSFLNVFNAGVDLPEINFANHCEDMFPAPANKLRTCPDIGRDIKYCQKKGKTLILSLGGAIARTGFISTSAASEFADTLWNMFMEGKHKYRPFGDAVVDGIDLDLEGGSQDHYEIFLSKLQNHYKSSQRKYYVTAAPQCEFPDRNLQTIMEKGHIDAIFIQFYNNWCGVQNYNNPWAWNWPTWVEWARTKSFNKNVKLYLGVPASRTAAGTGYIETPALEKIITDLKKDSIFGGVMLWDTSQSEHNLVNGKPFGSAIKDFLVANGNCPVDPPTTTSSTTSTESSTSTTESSTETHTPTETSTETHTPTETSTETQTPTETSTEPTTTTEKPTKTTDTPQPTDVCPVEGAPCSGGSACSGTKYAVCNYGKWVVRSCGSGTVCAIQHDQAYCDFPGNNPPPPCSDPKPNFHYVRTKSLVHNDIMVLPF